LDPFLPLPFPPPEVVVATAAGVATAGAVLDTSSSSSSPSDEDPRSSSDFQNKLNKSVVGIFEIRRGRDSPPGVLAGDSSVSIRMLAFICSWSWSSALPARTATRAKRQQREPLPHHTAGSRGDGMM